jgi:hypothetical protein
MTHRPLSKRIALHHESEQPCITSARVSHKTLSYHSSRPGPILQVTPFSKRPRLIRRRTATRKVQRFQRPGYLLAQLEDFPKLEQTICGRRCDLVNDVPGGLDSLKARRAFTLRNKPKEDHFMMFVLPFVLDNVKTLQI